MTLAWGAKVRGRWRLWDPFFFRPLRVKGLFCARTGRAAFLFRRNPVECGKLYTDSASIYRLIMGYEHDSVNHTKKEYARGDVHENRAECLFSLLELYLRVFRGISKTNLPGYVGFFQFLRNFHQLTAFEQAELILHAALD